MCGICGIYSTQGISNSDYHLIHRMSDALIHRGPDDYGTFQDSHIALGHRRLSIIDLSGGHQPMANEDETVWVVSNGEIYNYKELRSELKHRGHTFRTASDTETIVHAYEEYGQNCVQHLFGMFAFAIWDTRTKSFFAARDRLGKKPLYYTYQKGRLVFASELKSILQDPTITLDINPIALHHYLTLQYVPDPLSIYKNIYKLPPAYILTCNADGMHIQRYWDISYCPKWEIKKEEAMEELRRLLKQAVQRRMISDRPLGAFLSGGIDSSIVTGLMSQISSRPVKTFSIGFTNEAFSELPAARLVSNRWNTDHHEFIVTYDRVEEYIFDLVRAFDEPFADSCALQTFYLAKLTKQEVCVALNGDGGDESFAGYPRYWLDRYAKIYSALPNFITQHLVPNLLDWIPEPTDIPIESNYIAGIKRLAQVARITPKASIIRWGSYFNEEMKKNLYTSSMLTATADVHTADILANDFDRAQAHSFLDRTLYVDTLNYLPGNNLVKMDRMTMAHALEARSPFLDHQYIEFVARLPEKWKLHGLGTKYLLRKTFADLMPTGIQKLPKRGFAAPIEDWLKGELRSFVHDLLLSNNSYTSLFFDRQSLLTLINENERGTSNHGRRIWNLLMFEAWGHNMRKEH